MAERSYCFVLRGWAGAADATRVVLAHTSQPHAEAGIARLAPQLLQQPARDGSATIQRRHAAARLRRDMLVDIHGYTHRYTYIHQTCEPLASVEQLGDLEISADGGSSGSLC